MRCTGYVYGSAGSRETTDNNAEAFKKWALVPSYVVLPPLL